MEYMSGRFCFDSVRGQANLGKMHRRFLMDNTLVDIRIESKAK